MIYKGYKIRVKCIDWEQVNILGQFWKYVSSFVESGKIIGLGMNWTKDFKYFDYALGVIEDSAILDRIKNIDFDKGKFNAEYIEIKLPDLEEWTSYVGKSNDLKEIYEKEIDCYNKTYDYELEYIDGSGNIEIKIHYID